MKNGSIMKAIGRGLVGGSEPKAVLREHVEMLRREGSSSSLSGALRIRMLVGIRRGLRNGVTFSDLGMKDAGELEAIITLVEQRTSHDAKTDKTLFARAGMTEEDASMFFRFFLQELLFEDGERRTREIMEKSGEHAYIDP